MAASKDDPADMRDIHGGIHESLFAPAPWCRDGHLQTLWPYLVRHWPRPQWHRRRVELPDGDFVDVDHHGPVDGPLVLVLHGLEGNSGSHYVRGLATALAGAGIATAVMHHRGCSGVPNRYPRSYHSGWTADLVAVLAEHKARGTPVRALVGYSLGGNVILKHLGETGNAAGVEAAVAVSVPFLLDLCARHMEHGLSRIYQWQLIRNLRRSTLRKLALMSYPVALPALGSLRTFHEFDTCVTAPLNGYLDAADYYRDASCRRFLAHIRVPTLVLQALDDPLMPPAVLPTESELSPYVRIETSAHGGHVGFVSGRWPWHPRYWLEERITEYLGQCLGTGYSAEQALSVAARC